MLASKPPGRVLISVFQIDLGHIAFHDYLRSKRTRGVRQPLENVTGLIACRQLRQAASLKEQIVRMFVLKVGRSEEHTSELQSHSDLVCRLLLEKKNTH